MLFQITNKCLMGCPHCMDDSKPDGGMMPGWTFHAAAQFAKANGERHILISGGEPTEHPDFLPFCRMASRIGLKFSFASNGMWLGELGKEKVIEEIATLPGFVGGQIYSNPKWYRLHDQTLREYNLYADKWNGLHIFLDTSEIRSMSDIGRAKNCPAAMEEVVKSKFHNMCLTSCVTAVQCDTLENFFLMMLMQHRFCTPMIDYKGNLHMSESILCPSIGNVTKDDAATLWKAMKEFRPCGGCTPCRRFLTEDDPKMAMARKLLGMEKINI